MPSPIRYALLSVSDKTGLAEFARVLHDFGNTLLSTGGTAEALRKEGLPVVDVAELTGSPEILDGRVKTLHPHIYAGLLARPGDHGHAETLLRLGIAPIDFLVVNLYPFENAAAANAPFDQSIETIDIGGPAMIRAAAKNHESVAVVVDPADYAALGDELRRNAGALGRDARKRLAAKAFARTAAYDAAISNWFLADGREEMPDYFAVGGKRLMKLRYGENPHQLAAFYSTGERPHGVAALQQIQGKELSYNNIADTDAALQCVGEFQDRAACVIVKHANPCGVALAGTPVEAYRRALACDPMSAFGGIVALNRPLDGKAAEEIVKIFTEVIAAPDATKEARSVLAGKHGLRLLLAPALCDKSFSVRSVGGGMLVQSRDNAALTPAGLRVVTKRQPSAAEVDDLIFAFTVAKHVKSNAIVYVKNLATVGIGAGQMSRLDASRIAAQKAADAARLCAGASLTAGSVVASDAFFPFADGLLAAVEAGATAVIQPGGSVRDAEVIAAADSAGVAMVFTGIRHFRH